MRKYFLLTAAALLVTTSANATTDYAEVTAKATIEVANKIACNNLDYGTIVMKQNNDISTLDDLVNYGEYVINGDIISHTGSNHIECELPSKNFYAINFPNVVELRSTTTDSILHISDIATTDNDDTYAIIGTKLTIPADVKAGEYTGSFTITDTY